MNNDIRYLAPAKLNLFLHINGRRDDGYHELQTLFQFIDLADELTILPTKEPQIELRAVLAGVNSEDNLIVRAAKLLQAHGQTKQGAIIELNKRLPMGAGIGGGSSDAATTLVVLNRLWQLHLTTTELATLGCALGADVPIFTHGHAAFAEGIGEQFTPAEPECCWYVLLTPPVSVSTARIFASPDLPRNTPKFAPAQYNFKKTRNDCQTIVTQHYPEVAQALDWLVEYAPARMTGTGSCVFAPFTTERQARTVAMRCPPEFAPLVCRGLNQSPLHEQIARLGI
ncbi:4-(cytidine 5'-diphospho)-2-C-methyl-D-erythritol kinase [Celerinatantimonas yamalensis]|uniref:4-diphosphocytidyl-2-C-methyl-D-erythritol kinase n=2 Tax=Celerinatantimonas yamalensis TaxID=559956 RepID=A0ABW9G6E8_9GAMM